MIAAVRILDALQAARVPVATAALAAAVCVGGCGGGGKTKTVTQTTTVKVQPTTKATSKAKLRLQQFVGKAGPKFKLQKTTKVKAGDQVAFVTAISNQAQAKGTKLELKVDKGPARTLKIQAGNANRPATASASLTSSDGKSIGLAPLKYKCVIAPATLCPADKATETKSQFVVVFDTPTTPGARVGLTSTVIPGK